MKTLLPIIILSFSIWMLVDAWRNKVPYYWYLIILFVPFGAVIYFAFAKLSGNTSDSTPPTVRRDNVETRREAFEQSPNVENRLQLARALSDAGNHAAALQEYQSVLVTHPKDKDALFGAGSAAFALGDFKAAIGYLESVTATHPAFSGYAAWQLLAEALWSDGDQQKGTESMARLCKVSHRIDHQLILARCYLELKQTADARAILEEAIADYNLAKADIQKQSRGQFKQVQRMLRSLS